MLVDAPPKGYEIYENPNARVFLRRVPARVFTKQEIAIVIFEPDQDVETFAKAISSYLWPDRVALKKMLKSTVNYSPVMRFVLPDDDEREFQVERMCYIGPDPD